MIKPSGVSAVKLFSLVCIVFLVVPVVALAVDFQPLVGIPGVNDEGGDQTQGGFANYINALYVLAISIAGLLAVIKLIIAGTKYMLTDIVTSKEDAKKDIKGALIGLLIVLGAVVILTTINADLVEVETNVPQIEGVNDAGLQVPRYVTAADACSGAEGCEILDCPLSRDGNWFASCQTWCAETGANSEFIQNGIIGCFTNQCTHQCIVRSTTAATDDNLLCTDRGTADDGTALGFDCGAAETYCRDVLNGTPRTSGGESRVNCNL